MQFRAIKRGKMIELPEELNIPDGQEIIVDIQECQLIQQEKRLQEIHEIIDNWDDEALIAILSIDPKITIYCQ
jgi:hypothetical protein